MNKARLDGKRVLIVEDEVILALDLGMTIGDAGGVVVGPAHRVSAGLEIVGSMTPDAAILDVDLRGEAVFPLAVHLRDAGVPFVFHTGRASVDGLRREFPRTTLLRKPALNSQIVRALASLMHHDVAQFDEARIAAS